MIWYADRRDWDPVTAQVHGTVHVQFPPAHHLDVAIPMFDLPEAQRRVEAEFPDEVPVVRWSLRYYLECCRQCQLYDYTKRRWVRFPV